MLLEGKKAVVTGGSRGIGKEIVQLFLKEGASVTFMDLFPSDFMGEFESLAKEKGTKVVFKKADVSSEEEVNSVVKEILSESGGVDVLVNNAGITRDGLVFRMPLENWEMVLKINLTSAFLISKHIAMAMMKQRSGSIINMASVVGIGGNAGQTNYSASKAGLIGFTKSLAKEVASRGVRVNAVAPGYIDTEMTKKLDPKAQEAMLSQVPMGRAGTPEEVAKVVLFLASDLSSYITGRVIQIDGGMAI
ncbi:MAG TPA: 3-oxoacyl-[acyl-carrier-protein] reductase [Spirochaetia bacterium]|nr:3-oxoacyl-[acyl-carrier-protein] reductase [Spirochaetia bacterium]